jgi:hypothetical protein
VSPEDEDIQPILEDLLFEELDWRQEAGGRRQKAGGRRQEAEGNGNQSKIQNPKSKI